jgi:hypothetical protein
MANAIVASPPSNTRLAARAQAAFTFVGVIFSHFLSHGYGDLSG